MSRVGSRGIGAGLVALALLALGLWNLGGPPVLWDEGWTFSVARSWVERGHYGRLLDGQPAPPGLEASFPVTVPVALAFRLLGVGVWQGRAPGVLFMVAALGLLYVLAARAYGRRVAVGALLVLLLTPMHPQLHPLFIGRQALGEMPMLTYLLAGYACLYMALDRSAWWILPAALLWALALIAKAQLAPFFAVSLLAPLALALLTRRWRAALLLAAGLPASWLASRQIAELWWLAMREHTLPGQGVQGLYEITAVVFTSFNRLFALRMTLLIGLPLLLGLAYATWRLWRERAGIAVENGRDTLRLALLGLSGSWFAWFVLLSVGVPRYLFPAAFVGSIFVAALLADLTGGLSPRIVFDRASAILRLRFDRYVVGTWLVICLATLTVLITLVTLNRYYLNNTNRDLAEVADFLNTRTAPRARIETYESELHFLLDRSYHYPPDQIHVELNRRSLTHQDVPIDYDPLAADPDYLVVGSFARDDGLYQPALDSGAFRLLKSFGIYQLYERVRAPVTS